MLAAFAADRPYLAVNICAGAGHSVREILQKILKVDGYDGADVRYDPSRPSTIPVRLMDNSLARQLGFEAHTSPRTACAERSSGIGRTGTKAVPPRSCSSPPLGGEAR